MTDEPIQPPSAAISTRGYQQEMLEASLRENIIIALDTGSGKTHIAVLRMKHECEREERKLSWFLAPTVALCRQQQNVIAAALPVSVGLISGSDEPDQWKDHKLWRTVLSTHRIMVSTPQVLLNALHHAYVDLGRDVSLLVFDEAHHTVDNHPYNEIMKNFYFRLPPEQPSNGPQSLNVRPKVLGLTASPTFGSGDVEKTFRNLESNLDCTIRAPRIHREELATHVYRPQFKHAMYSTPDQTNPPYSTNLSGLQDVLDTLNIENDPYVLSLRNQLARLPKGPERSRLDQKLSKTILKKDSYTHKGLTDFERAASEICEDVGPWAADWYIQTVVEHAKATIGTQHHILGSWKGKEKAYLLGLLDQITIIPVSYESEEVMGGTTNKVQALLHCLQVELADAEEHNEAYSGIIFVTRRDTVLALAEVISRHPWSSGLFEVGCLLGASESAYRKTFLDITRKISRHSHEDTLQDFRLGEKNLIVSTSVAEEGIDIQACGSVIRWDIPQNMVSWAQSRGRARQKRSTFTLLFQEGGAYEKEALRWEALEQEMIALYNDDTRQVNKFPFDPRLYDNSDNFDDGDDEFLEFRVESTGALLTLQSAIPHLNHFCSVIPSFSQVPFSPIFDIDPPEMPEGWHSFSNRDQVPILPYPGPFGSTITLPRSLPPHLWVFSTERKYPTKVSAHQHAAFRAYVALYHDGLLDDHLLPLMNDIKPQLDEEVKELLKDVEKRASMAGVSCQMDPWAPSEEASIWKASELAIDGLAPLLMFTRSRPITLSKEDGPTLYRRDHDPIKVQWCPREDIVPTDVIIEEARHYTHRLYCSLSHTLPKWENMEFANLFLPTVHPDKSVWDTRRSWLAASNLRSNRTDVNPLFANAAKFGAKFSYPNDLNLIASGNKFAKNSRFVRWEFDPISPEEEDLVRKAYTHYTDLEIAPPFLVVQPLPRRFNFLVPIPSSSAVPSVKPDVLLIPGLSSVALFTETDAEYVTLIPSIIYSLSMAATAQSLRENLFANTPLFTISLESLMTAITAPVSQAQNNYQRLETLGDTVLKFIVGVQLLAEYPIWHEGYLAKKKDHSVSNVRLAKEAVSKGLYRWIIRNRLLLKGWKPPFHSTLPDVGPPVQEDEPSDRTSEDSKKEELSTKMLADVVEALIGAAYLEGSFELAIECARLFGLGVPWLPLSQRIDTMLTRVDHVHDIPTQIAAVETMLNYEFTHKILLIEALTHSSYHQSLYTRSYERMEFFGDSIIDMVVTDMLYRAPGKKYGPGHMHLRKSAVVNQHFLAFICLRCALSVDAAIPRRGERGSFALVNDSQPVYLWQCLLHSSLAILEEQNNTFARYKKNQADIEAALQSDPVFPWSALTRLQAPKIFSDLIESIIGAVYLDSRGSFEVVNKVLRVLGIPQILERIIKDNVDVLHPVSRLSIWATNHGKEITYTFGKEKGRVSCVVLIDDKEATRVEQSYRGRTSQDEVKLLAAEQTIKDLKLRTSMVSRRKKGNLAFDCL